MELPGAKKCLPFCCWAHFYLIEGYKFTDINDIENSGIHHRFSESLPMECGKIMDDIDLSFKKLNKSISMKKPDENFRTD